MTYNHKKIHKDINNKAYRMGKSQDEISKEIGLGRSTIWRLSKRKEISVTNFFKIISWLDNGLEKYLVNEKYYD